MLQDTAHEQQQAASGRCSASEQPEALSQALSKNKLFMTSSDCSTQQSLTSTQQQALSAIDARLHLLGDYAVEAFKCQLWEPSRAVQELEPGTTPYCELALYQLMSTFKRCVPMISCTAPFIDQSLTSQRHAWHRLQHLERHGP